MIATLLLQAAVTMTLDASGRQALPASGCAAFLWSREVQPQLLAMVGTTPATLRLRIDGRVVTLARSAAEGAGSHGLSATARYAGAGLEATVEMTTVERPDLADGALVTDATLTVAQAGHDTIVAPAGGMIGCTPAKGK